MSRSVVPPCEAACPITTDVQQYVYLASLGKFAEAFEVARATNPFPATLGRICMHPCETACRRCQVDEAVSIMAVKRAAVDYGAPEARGQKPQASSLKPPASRVAVVGAGPAGLTAAQDLLGLGYDVTVFEKEKEPGGMLALAVPKYRLPREVLKADIDAIKAHGVKIELGRAVGQDIALADLKAQGFEAVVVAAGLPVSQGLRDWPISEHVHLALPFLRAANEGSAPPIGRRVAVIGGGNVAIDAARSTLREGAGEVTILYRRTREEMPASDTEIEEATAEDVKIEYLVMPGRAVEKDGHLAGVELTRAKLGEPDESGRRRPVPIDGSTFVHECDTVVIAIGQTHDPAFLGDESQAALDGKLKGVFLAGDLSGGPGSAAEAIQSGHMAAQAVARHLGGRTQAAAQAERLADLAEAVKGHIKRRERGTPEDGLKRPAAVSEALRCLSCVAGPVVDKEKCVACLTCVRVCPYEVPVIGEAQVAEIDPVGCQACGICVTECPARAITFLRDQDELVLADLEAALQSSKKIEFHCQNRGADDRPAGGWARVGVRCLAQVSTETILRAYEMGAEHVLISGCGDQDCAHWDGNRWARDRVGQAKAVLEEIGRGADLLELKEKTA